MDPPSSAGMSLRPWSSVLSLSTISLPQSLPDLSYRLSTNLRHFHLNYLTISLALLFLSLLLRPLAALLFLLTASAWFYFLRRHDPLVVFDRAIDHRAIVLGLGVVTVVAVVVADVWVNVVAAVGVAAVVVGVVAGGREPVEEQETSPYGSLLADSPRGGYTQV